MRIIITAFVGLLALLATASCGSGSVPASSIYLLERDTNRILSTSRNRGELTLQEGQVYHFMVERLTNNGDQTNTADVTTVSNYSFVPDTIASANALGELRGLRTGTTRLEARFRPDGLSDADRVYLDITVVPAAE